MKRNLILFFLLLIALGIFAQESIHEKRRKEYLSATMEQKALMDSIYQPVADKIAKEQVKTIGGIPFGISHSKAEVMLRNKFGIPNSDPSTTTLFFRDIKYAGHDFASVYFMFQSDGINSYLNGCVFITNASSLSDAIKKEKYIADDVLSKYTLFESKDSDGYPIHSGGISPLWDGHWASLDFDEYGNGLHTDIIKYDSDWAKTYGYPYAVRIIYGPYNYVKEEF